MKEGTKEALLSPYRMGDLELPNRLVMAPMTRNRAPGCVANELIAQYYAQRASAGLIVTEGTQVAPLGQGYQATPGIYSDEQREGWRLATDAVHRAGGRIFAQLWHVGRVSHSYYHGQTPVAPSAIAVPGKAYTPQGMVPYETPRALSTDEVRDVVEQFRHAAATAREAGFDGVEVHGANGYLVDQFLQSGTNQRTDRYGGSLENRLRFLREVMEAVVGEWPERRAGVRLSPAGGTNGIHDEDPVATFGAAAEALNAYPLAFLHVVEAPVGHDGPDDHGVCSTELVRQHFRGTLISTGGYSPQSARRALAAEHADLIGFGRLFISNPDLPRRIALDAPLAEAQRETFYAPGPEGYVDYPTLAAA
jgi:N-ethylmaleimide reductase